MRSIALIAATLLFPSLLVRQVAAAAVEPARRTLEAWRGMVAAGVECPGESKDFIEV
jgi:hypothetical protein